MSSGLTVSDYFSPYGLFRSQNDPNHHGCPHISALKAQPSSALVMFSSYRVLCRLSLSHRNRAHFNLTKKGKKALALVEDENSKDSKVNGDKGKEKTKKRKRTGSVENELQIVEKLPLIQCCDCDDTFGRLHACLQCVYVGCMKHNHLKIHMENHKHDIAVDMVNCTALCVRCNDYIYDLDLERILDSEKSRMEMLISRVKEPEVKRQKYAEWTPSAEESELIREASHLQRCSGLRGLRNMGATCFMNVILQSFVHNPLLKAHFLSDRHSSTLCVNSKCVACELDRLFANFYSGDQTPYGPSSFLHYMWLSHKELASAQQHDAHEFLISALNTLHTNCSGMPRSYSDCQCIIHQVFGGILQSEVTCQQCGTVSTTEDPFLDMSLDLRSATLDKKKTAKKFSKPAIASETTPDDESNITPENLQSKPKIKPNLQTQATSVDSCSLVECLDRFTHPEKLGAKNYVCSQCGNAQEAMKQLSVKKLPPVLGVQLKRFEHTATSSSKVETHVRIPYELDMTPYTTRFVTLRSKKATTPGLSTPSSSSGTTGKRENTPRRITKSFDAFNDCVPTYKYQLFAIVNHQGKLETGHYTSFAKSRGQWFAFDDHSITNVSQQEVLNGKSAYICFYAKDNLEYFPHSPVDPSCDPFSGATLKLDSTTIIMPSTLPKGREEKIEEEYPHDVDRESSVDSRDRLADLEGELEDVLKENGESDDYEELEKEIDQYLDD
ncbi:hypothetical protein BJ742DRAFT_710206 [Cladochytrium replicatum]|nr:hypothetical protein BJ742DRAFT_710206 [Cladochytrium replicatum]